MWLSLRWTFPPTKCSPRTRISRCTPGAVLTSFHCTDADSNNESDCTQSPVG